MPVNDAKHVLPGSKKPRTEGWRFSPRYMLYVITFRQHRACSGGVACAGTRPRRGYEHGAAITATVCPAPLRCSLLTDALVAIVVLPRCRATRRFAGSVAMHRGSAMRPETSRVNRDQIWTGFALTFVWVHQEARVQRLAITHLAVRDGLAVETRAGSRWFHHRSKSHPRRRARRCRRAPLAVIATSPEGLLAWASPVRVSPKSPILRTRRSRRAHRPVRCRCRCRQHRRSRGSGKPVQNGPGPRLGATRSVRGSPR